MRVARYFPTVVAVLANFALQATTSSPCGAWDSIPAAALAESRDMDGGDYIIDDQVQPAGFYDSRPRPNANRMPRPVAQSKMGQSTSSAVEKSKSTKQSILPFGRQTASGGEAARMSAQMNAANAAMPNAARGAVRVPPQQRSQNARAQRMPMGTPIQDQPGMNAQGARVATARMPQSIPQSQLQPPTAGPSPRAMGLPTTKGPGPNASTASPWAPPGAAAPMAKPMPAASQSSGGPLSAADELVAKAHELSTQAQSDQEFTQVVDLCRQAQVSQPNPTTAQYAKHLIAWSLNRRGQLKAEAGDDKAALQDFDEAIRHDATCWRAVHNRGVLLAQDSQFEKAFDDFSRTIQMNPNFAKAYSNRAALFMVANNLDAALHDYNRAIGLDTNLAVAHRGCGRVCQLTGRMEEAMAHYDVAVRLAPTDSYAAACRADLLTDLGRYSEAAKEYNRAIEIDPKSTQAVSGSAWLLATCPDSQIRNADLAIQRAQTVIELGGDNDAVNFDTLAAAQANAGDFDAAMDSLEKAIDLAPTEECEAYKERMVMYQQAKPYRISPMQHVAQVSYESADAGEGVAR